MTKRSRTILFIISVLLFLSATPSVIFYSQGYRVDFETKKIVKTGGLSFRVLPGKAQVYLNGQLEKSTSMLTNSVFIENLLPKTYEIEIKKEGYHPWKKNLEVKEAMVAEAENITLFPQNPQFVATNQNISKIKASATSTDKKKAIESDGYELWVIFLEGEERVFLTRFSEKIENIFWLNDYYLIFNAGDKIKIAEIDDRDGLNIIDLAEFKSPEIFWDKDAKKLYVVSGKKTYLLEHLLP
ncbi:MAG: hypothetical protein HYW69_01030 [Candidatus Nealsonbacteria bacterium]|nr:hypothetical protein [Candidatus Nealsonbacteria bacterium]